MERPRLVVYFGGKGGIVSKTRVFTEFFSNKGQNH